MLRLPVARSTLGADTLNYTQIGDKAKGVQIVARQNTRTSLRPGDPVGLDVAPDSFHLFDCQGRAVSAAAH